MPRGSQGRTRTYNIQVQSLATLPIGLPMNMEPHRGIEPRYPDYKTGIIAIILVVRMVVLHRIELSTDGFGDHLDTLPLRYIFGRRQNL